MPSPALTGLSMARPLALGLLALAVVVGWLHYRRRPGRRVVVASLAPWLALVPEAVRRRRRIPPSLLLALHLLVAVLLALIAAGPGSAPSEEAAPHTVVVLDASGSMAAGDRWRAAAGLARGVAASAPGPVSLVAAGARSEAVLVRDADRARVERALASVRPGDVGSDMVGALRLAAAIGGPDADVYVISDGGEAPPDGVVPGARWLGVGESLSNLAVVEARARTVAGQTRLFARVASFAEAELQADLRLLVDGAERDRRRLEFGPGEAHDLVWSVSERDRLAEVRLDARDARPDDDWAAVPLRTAPLRVQLVGSSRAVARALAGAPDTDVVAAGTASYRTDGTVDVTIAVGGDLEVWPPGGIVLVGPPAADALGSRGDVGVSITSVGDHPISAGLELLEARVRPTGDGVLPAWAEPVLEAGSRIVAYAGVARGTRVVGLGFDPDGEGIAERTAYPVLLARAVRWAAGDPAAGTVPVGTEWPLPGPAARVAGPDRAPGGGLDDWLVLRTPGLYEIGAGSGSDARVRQVGARAGDMRESDLTVRWPPSSPPPEAGAVLGGGWRPWLPLSVLAVLLVEGGLRAGLLRRWGRRS